MGNIKVGQDEIEQVKGYKHLGNIIMGDMRWKQEMKTQTSIANDR